MSNARDASLKKLSAAGYSECTVKQVLSARTGLPANAPEKYIPVEAEDELCEENASATVEGTIKEIEDVTDENETEKTWLLWPDTDTQKSSCLYEGIFIHGSLSKDCKAGSKFSLTGVMGPKETGDDTAILVDKITCGG